MAQSFGVGDIFEIDLRPGFSYVRLAYSLPKYGDALGVIDSDLDKRYLLNDLSGLTERWFFLADIKTMVARGDFAFIGKGKPPFSPPVGVRIPAMGGWKLQGNEHDEAAIFQTLTSEEMRRPIEEGLPIQILRALIRGGYDASRDNRDLIERIKSAASPLSSRLPQA